MSDAVPIAILLAAFALAIGLVQVLGRLIDSGGRDGWDDEPPDTGGTRADTADPGRHRPGPAAVTASATGGPARRGRPSWATASQAPDPRRYGRRRNQQLFTDRTSSRP
jgi:hypothetical protein